MTTYQHNPLRGMVATFDEEKAEADNSSAGLTKFHRAAQGSGTEHRDHARLVRSLGRPLEYVMPELVDPPNDPSLRVVDAPYPELIA